MYAITAVLGGVKTLLATYLQLAKSTACNIMRQTDTFHYLKLPVCMYRGLAPEVNLGGVFVATDALRHLWGHPCVLHVRN